MTVISIYEDQIKLAEVLIEPKNQEILNSRNQPIIASIDWVIKGDQTKIDFLENLSETNMLGGHSSPSFEFLLQNPNWVFPSLNDFLFMLEGLEDIYSYEGDNLPENSVSVDDYQIPHL